MQNKDPQNFSRLKIVVKREKDILKICKDGLRFYGDTLERQEHHLGVLFKVKNVRKIRFMREYVEELRCVLSKLEDRITEETTELEVMDRIAAHSNNYIDTSIIKNFYKILESEKEDLLRNINDKKLKEMEAIDSFAVSLVNNVKENNAWKVIKWLIDNDIADSNAMYSRQSGLGTAVAGSMMWIIGLVVSLLALITDPLIKLTVGLKIDAESLNKSIEQFQGV